MAGGGASPTASALFFTQLLKSRSHHLLSSFFIHKEFARRQRPLHSTISDSHPAPSHIPRPYPSHHSWFPNSSRLNGQHHSATIRPPDNTNCWATHRFFHVTQAYPCVAFGSIHQLIPSTTLQTKIDAVRSYCTVRDDHENNFVFDGILLATATCIISLVNTNLTQLPS